MKKILRISGLIVGGLLLLIVLLFGYFWVTEFTPAKVEISYQSTDAPAANLPDTLTIVSWNIGYAGLGDDMDFFYDGGKTTRASKERTALNLKKIVEFLQIHNNADFIVLQEVDFDSKRSDGINEQSVIQAAMPNFESCIAYNYVSKYVPIPFSDPIGSVQSGLVTMSRHPILIAQRLQYPSEFAFPVRLFNLKRCMLTCQIVTDKGDTLYVNNTHNTAYDTGGMRSAELAFMNTYLQNKPYSFTAGDWNCNPPGYKASAAALADKNFSPMVINDSDFSSDMTFLADTITASTRYGYQPYKKGETTTTMLDFALLGRSVMPISVQTVDLGFQNSDHNPVVYKVVVEQQ